MDLEQLTRRVAAAEQEIARARAEIATVRQHCQRLRRSRLFASAGIAIAGVTIAGLMSSRSMSAQGGAPGMTVKAPFTVVDDKNIPVLTVRSGSELRGFAVWNAAHQSVIEVGTAQAGEAEMVVRSRDRKQGAFLRMKFDEPELELRNSDNKSFVHLQRSGAALQAPLTVADPDDHPIAIVQDGPATTAAASPKPGALPRGVHVMNDKGTVVARAAADKDGNGFLIAREATGKGAAVAMLAGAGGGQLTVAGADGKVTADLASKTGLNIYNDSAAAVVEISGHTGSGRLWLGNLSGTGIVEAGMIPDGRGVIRAGPRMGGPLGEGQLALPFAIMGRK